MSGYVRYDYAWKTPGWTAQNPTFTSQYDSYVDPGLPDDVSLVRVYGDFLENNTGRSLEGVVRFRTNRILNHTPTNRQIMPGVKRVRFRPGGFSIMLPATDDPQLTPNDWQYECLLTVAGFAQEFSFSLPAATPEVNITSLIPTG